jgi:Uma2 family endonuclease
MPIDLLELPMPITLRPAAPVSNEELMRLSQANQAYRLERNKEGEITMMAPLTGNSGSNEILVSAELFVWARSNGRGRTFSPNTGFVLPDGSCLMPDACWVANDRWNRLTPEQRDEYVPLCPDFVIEVRSKTDRRRALEAKMQVWMENGAKLGWLIDPREGSATIYQPGRAERTLQKPDIIEGVDPVAGFGLHASELWSAE